MDKHLFFTLCISNSLHGVNRSEVPPFPAIANVLPATLCSIVPDYRRFLQDPDRPTLRACIFETIGTAFQDDQLAWLALIRL